MPVFRKKNEDFFKTWTTDMVYVLGFLIADGCIFKNKRGACFTEIQSTDREIIYKIRRALSSDLKISKTIFPGNNRKNRYRIQIGSKKMFQDLCELGVTPKKTHTARVPKKLPIRFYRDFVRGYFDGDGCVSVYGHSRDKKHLLISCGFTSGSERILRNIFNFLRKGVVNGGTLHFSGNAYRLWFSVKDSRRLYDFMYKDLESNLFLSRKRKKFEKFFAIG